MKRQTKAEKQAEMAKFARRYSLQANSNGSMTAVVTMGDVGAVKMSEDEYERLCTEAMTKLRRDLPRGWKAEWAGYGHANSDGTVSEEITISRKG
jgi:hypothetical protein